MVKLAAVQAKMSNGLPPTVKGKMLAARSASPSSGVWVANAPHKEAERVTRPAFGASPPKPAARNKADAVSMRPQVAPEA